MLPKSIKKLNRSKLTLGILFLSIFYIFLGKEAYALTLSPPRLEVSGDPGQTLVGELEIYNEQESEITFYVSAQNFEARGETGSPYFLPYDGTGLASWIFAQDSITLGPKERAKLPYEIVIPQDAEAGGYFASIFFATSPQTPEEAGQVTIGSKVGTLVFLNVSGDAPEGAGVIEFKTKGGNMFPYLPITLYYRFSNNGARKVMPLGDIQIKSMFGNLTATLDANRSKGNVLPGSIRRFEVAWSMLGQDSVEEKDLENMVGLEEGQKLSFFDAVRMQKDNFAIGKYTADLNLKYGDNETTSAQATFWVIPWQILSLVAGGLLLIIIIIKLMMKRHNKKLIEQVKKETLANQQVTIAPTEKVDEKNETEEVKPETEITEEETPEEKPEPINPKE
jgi:hypothetical protein